jgi:hypothetical protein
MKARALVLEVLAFAWAVRTAQATSLLRLSLDQLSQAASDVVRGRVISQETRWNENHTRIVTITTLAVDQAFKGHPPRTIEIEQPGGTIGDIHVHVAGVVRFQPQSSYWLFLEPSTGAPSRYLVVGMVQGAFQIYREPSTGQERVVLPLGSLVRGSVAGSGQSVIPGPALSLQEFQQSVAASLAAPPAIPPGTAISVVIRSTESRGVGRLRVVAQTTADVFPDSGLAIPAGSTVEGTAVRASRGWKIHWDEVSIRGARVPISAGSDEPADGSLAGRMFLVQVR